MASLIPQNNFNHEDGYKLSAVHFNLFIYNSSS